MASKVCPNCHEDFRNSFDTRLFRSSVCGHSCCSRCMVAYSNVKMNQAKGLQWVEPDQLTTCLICGVQAKVKTWEDTIDEEMALEKEASVRSRVMAILNGDRLTFQTTPLYHQFLEEREDIIYDLSFVEDENLRKSRNEYLRHYELENQQKILEATERYRQKDTDNVRSIVEREGLFYEMVNQDFGPNFIRKDPKSKLLHPLQRENPQYFLQETGNARDIRSTGPGAQQFGSGQGILNQLHQNLPKPLVPNIDYMRLKRQRVEFHLSRDAGGHRKETVMLRTKAESFAGFRLS